MACSPGAMPQLCSSGSLGGWCSLGPSSAEMSLCQPQLLWSSGPLTDQPAGVQQSFLLSIQLFPPCYSLKFCSTEFIKAWWIQLIAATEHLIGCADCFEHDYFVTIEMLLVLRMTATVPALPEISKVAVFPFTDILILPLLKNTLIVHIYLSGREGE